MGLVCVHLVIKDKIVQQNPVLIVVGNVGLVHQVVPVFVIDT